MFVDVCVENHFIIQKLWSYWVVIQSSHIKEGFVFDAS